MNKRQVVFTIVKDWAAKNKPSLEEIQTAFPTETQGSKGFVVKASEVKDASLGFLCSTLCNTQIEAQSSGKKMGNNTTLSPIRFKS